MPYNELPAENWFRKVIREMYEMHIRNEVVMESTQEYEIKVRRDYANNPVEFTIRSDRWPLSRVKALAQSKGWKIKSGRYDKKTGENIVRAVPRTGSN